jgi:Domain of unknown function (DUF4429)/Short C-terminal domain
MSQKKGVRAVFRLALKAAGTSLFLAALCSFIVVAAALVAIFTPNSGLSGSPSSIIADIIIMALGSTVLVVFWWAGLKVFAASSKEKVAFVTDKIEAKVQRGGKVIGEVGQSVIGEMQKGAIKAKERAKARAKEQEEEFTRRYGAKAVLGLTLGVADLAATSRLGSMFFNGHEVIIRKKGVGMFLFQGLVGEKTIPVSAIQAVQFRHARGIARGYLQLTITGGVEAKGGVLEAVGDENTVLFDYSEEPAFERLAAAIRAALRDRQSQRPAPEASALSAADELAKYAVLREKGHLTEAEFAEKKAQLLGL